MVVQSVLLATIPFFRLVCVCVCVRVCNIGLFVQVNAILVLPRFYLHENRSLLFFFSLLHHVVLFSLSSFFPSTVFVTALLHPSACVCSILFA